MQPYRYSLPPLEPSTTSQLQPPYQTQPQQMHSGLPTIDYYQSLSLYRQPLDPPDWQDHSTTNDIGHTEPFGMPRDPVTLDLEPHLSVVALVSKLERLTADVEQLVSRMDANERLSGDPHGQSLGLSPNPPQSPGYVQPFPYYQQPLTAVLPPQSLLAAAPSSMKKLNSTALGSVENTFEEHVTDLEKDGEGFSSCGEINTLHEISICVIHERDDCSSSPFGKRIMTEEFHKFDDKIINDEVNSDDGDEASFNLFCDSALDADARLIPPRTDTPSPQLCASSFWFDMSMDYPKEYWDAVDSRCLSHPYPSRSCQHAAPVVPPPPPQRSPSCWSSTSHCRSAAPLPSTLATPSLNLPPLAHLCSSDIIGDEGDLLDDDRPPLTMMTLSYYPNIRYDSMELIVDDSDESVKSCSSTAIDRLTNRDQVGVEELLDDDESDGFLKASLLSPMSMCIQNHCFRAHHEILWRIQIGLDVDEKICSFDVRTVVIYCRRLIKLGISSIQEVDAGAINVASLSTSWLCAKQLSCTFDPGGCTSPSFDRNGKRIEALIRSNTSTVQTHSHEQQGNDFAGAHETKDPNARSGFVIIMSANGKIYQPRAHGVSMGLFTFISVEEVADSESQIVVASKILISSGKVEAPLVDFLGRISEFGVLAEGLMNNRSKNCPRISPVDLFVMASSSTLFVASWFPP